MFRRFPSMKTHNRSVIPTLFFEYANIILNFIFSPFSINFCTPPKISQQTDEKVSNLVHVADSHNYNTHNTHPLPYPELIGVPYST